MDHAAAVVCVCVCVCLSKQISALFFLPRNHPSRFRPRFPFFFLGDFCFFLEYCFFRRVAFVRSVRAARLDCQAKSADE